MSDYEIPDVPVKHPRQKDNLPVPQPHKFLPKEVTFLQTYAQTLDWKEAKKAAGLTARHIRESSYIQAELAKIEGLVRQGYLLKAKLIGAKLLQSAQKFEDLHDKLIEEALSDENFPELDELDQKGKAAVLEAYFKAKGANVKAASQYAGIVARALGDAMRASGETSQQTDYTGPTVQININIEGDEPQPTTIEQEAVVIDVGEDE